MEINYLHLIVLTIVQFVFGALWYSLVFGKTWAKIHGFDLLPKEEQARMAKEVQPYYAIQLVLTIITTYTILIFTKSLMQTNDSWMPIGIAGWIWLGFIMPMQVQGVLWGNDKKEWMWKKIGIMILHQLLNFMIVGTILYYWK